MCLRYFIIFMFGLRWLRNPSSGSLERRRYLRKKQDLGKGEYTEGGNISGAFGGFSRGNFYVGWAVCSSNCETGFMPSATYVKLNDIWKPSVKNSTSRSTCVRQNGDTLQYCWNN